MFIPKKVTLADTLAKVAAFVKELQDGITNNDKEVDSLCTELEKIESKIKDIESQSDQARKLLNKIS